MFLTDNLDADTARIQGLKAGTPTLEKPAPEKRGGRKGRGNQLRIIPLRVVL